LKRKGKRKNTTKTKTENAKTENHLSVDENIKEALFVFEKFETLLATSTETLINTFR